MAKRYTVPELIEAFGQLQVKDVRWVLERIRWMLGDDRGDDGTAGVPVGPEPDGPLDWAAERRRLEKESPVIDSSYKQYRERHG